MGDKVKINKLKEVRHEVFDPEDNSLGFCTHEEFNDVRIQIGTQSLAGYYVMFEGQKIIINSDGSCERNPSGFFDLYEQQLGVLIYLRVSHKSRQEIKQKYDRYKHKYRHSS